MPSPLLAWVSVACTSTLATAVASSSQVVSFEQASPAAGVHASRAAELGSSLDPDADPLWRPVGSSMSAQACWACNVYDWFFVWAAWAIFCTVIAVCCYRHKCVEAESAMYGSTKDVMLHQHFQCTAETESCLGAFLCPSVRWADTMSMAGIMPFWHAYFFITFLVLANILLHSWLFFGPATAIGLLWCRHQLRAKLALPSFTIQTLLTDAMYSLFCPCCAIAQEARAVIKATEEGLVVNVVDAGTQHADVWKLPLHAPADVEGVRMARGDYLSRAHQYQVPMPELEGQQAFLSGTPAYVQPPYRIFAATSEAEY
mmetsp:Transcript_24373/g.44729  ORF Transcript_24373/g.44729 Transcript_24373/m.44729 type:complete len:315 (-) Transcript_24373:121-1065(-)